MSTPATRIVDLTLSLVIIIDGGHIIYSSFSNTTPGSGPGDICEDQIVEKKYRVLIFLIYLILVLDFSD